MSSALLHQHAFIPNNAVWLSFNINAHVSKEQEDPERQQKGSYAEKGTGTLRDNFYLRRTDLLEKANWIIFLILYFCCDIIKMHVTYQHSLFCIHNLKLKLISCHNDLTHLLMVPSQKSVLLQEKQLYVYTLEKNNRGELTGGHWTFFSPVQKIAIFILFSGFWTSISVLMFDMKCGALTGRTLCLRPININ